MNKRDQGGTVHSQKLFKGPAFHFHEKGLVFQVPALRLAGDSTRCCGLHQGKMPDEDLCRGGRYTSMYCELEVQLYSICI